VTTLVAPSGQGKTTLALSIALTVATGGFFGGRMIKRRPVVWIAGEGQDDLRSMYEAWIKDHPNCPVPEGFWLEEAIDLSNNTETDKLIKLLEGMPPALIVTDALADMIGDRDEDKSKDINWVYRNVWRVVRANKGAFLMPHHTGWDESREKGSAAIRAKSDIVVQITEFDVETGTIELRHNKRRGGRKLERFCFEMKLITVQGYAQPIPIVTGVQPDELRTILSRPIEVLERPARTLVELMLKELQPNGATWTEFKDASGMSKTSFRRAFNNAMGMEWFVGDGKKRGQRYNLNPNGCWKLQDQGQDKGQGASSKELAPNLAPILGANDQGHGPNLAPSGPLAPTSECSNFSTTASAKNPNQISETESSISTSNGKADSLLTMTSQALHHADKKKGD
jgi:AAA domain